MPCTAIPMSTKLPPPTNTAKRALTVSNSQHGWKQIFIQWKLLYYYILSVFSSFQHEISIIVPQRESHFGSLEETRNESRWSFLQI
jgi:hypothetical protein